MTPTRQNPKLDTKASGEESPAKGDTPMVRSCAVAVAIMLLTASWVGAGNFEVLAEAGVVRAPTPLYIKPGTLVKAEFKSNLKTSSDLDVESDALFPEKVSAKNEPKVTPRPAVAYRERSAGAMAPPPAAKKGSQPGGGLLAESLTQAGEMEEDLEKDLVLTPPPPKTEETEKSAPVSVRGGKELQEKSVVGDLPRKEKKKASVSVKQKRRAADLRRYSVTQKPIRKVKPLTAANNPWARPAGTHGDRKYQGNHYRHRYHHEYANEGTRYQAMTPPYMNSSPRGRIARPPTTQRYVRDGVTVKLAPAAASAVPPYYEEEGSADDILSTASEIIGLPFAFISSFF